MKILQINGVIHQGSTGAIVDDICRYLRSQNDLPFIAFGIGKHASDGFKFCYRYEQGFYRRVSMLIGYRYGFAPFSTGRLIKYIKKIKPDVVHLHSINGNCVNIYKLLAFLKKTHTKTVITNHAEFYYTGNCTSRHGCNEYLEGCHNCPQKKWASDNALVSKIPKSWMKMYDSFYGFNSLVCVSVSEYSKRCASKSPILELFPHKVIINGIDTDIFQPSFSIDIRKKYGISTQKIAIFVTSGFSLERNHLKGGYWFRKLVSECGSLDCTFLVVGCDNPGINANNVLFIGRISDKALMANLYSQVDISLGFSRSESFGMTCAESLCCGTPFVGFLCGGTESIAIKEFTRFVEYGDTFAMKAAMNSFFEDRKKNSDIANSARELYSSKRMAEEYYQLYHEMASQEENEYEDN